VNAAMRALNSLMVVAITAVLLAALSIQIFKGEEPCPLCYLQRVAFIGVAAGGVLNITCGLRGAHYGLSLLWAVNGAGIALRQIALHVCPQFPTFGVPLWGLGLYTWSFIFHSCLVLYVAFLLFMQEGTPFVVKRSKYTWWDILAIVVISFAVFVNVIVCFAQCGIGPCHE
jgi:disulfide bond formation protein DsbB